MREKYTRMLTWATYFDSRLSWYPNGWGYADLYAIYTESSLAFDHPEWILQSPSGESLCIPWGCANNVCPQWAGDFANADFRHYIIEKRVKPLVEKGYGGLFIDDVNLIWRSSFGDNDVVVPLDSNTGEPMTLVAWQDYMATFVEEIRAAFPSMEIAHNSIWYTDTLDSGNKAVDRQVDAADYVHLERGSNDAGLVAGDGRWGFETFLKFIDYIHARGRSVILMEYAGGRQAIEYGLAAYYLVNNGTDMLGGGEGNRSMSPDRYWDGYDANLGKALGPRYKNQRPTAPRF